MWGLDTLDCVDYFVRLRIEHLYKSIRLTSKEESVPVPVNGKMVEIPLLQSGKWDGPNEFEGSRVLSLKEKRNGE